MINKLNCYLKLLLFLYLQISTNLLCCLQINRVILNILPNVIIRFPIQSSTYNNSFKNLDILKWVNKVYILLRLKFLLCFVILLNGHFDAYNLLNNVIFNKYQQVGSLNMTFYYEDIHCVSFRQIIYFSYFFILYSK